jgi:hypothetical protein
MGSPKSAPMVENQRSPAVGDYDRDQGEENEEAGPGISVSDTKL